MLKSNSLASIECGVYLISSLSPIFLNDKEKNRYYVYEVICKKNLVEKLFLLKNEGSSVFKNMMEVIKICSSVAPLSVGSAGIDLAKKYLFDSNVDMKIRSRTILATIINYGKNESLNRNFINSKDFFQIILKLLDEENYEALNESFRILMGLFTYDSKLINELSSNKILELIEKTQKALEHTLKDNTFFTEAAQRHAEGFLFKLSEKYPKEIAQSKCLQLLFVRYFTYQVENTKSNFLLLFYIVLSRMKDEEAVSYVDRLFGGHLMLKKFENDVGTILKESKNEALKNNAVLAMRQLLLLTEEGKKAFENDGFQEPKQTFMNINKIRDYLPQNEIKKESPLVCFTCGARNATKKCGACKIDIYCSQECQKKDWKSHKPNCVQNK